MPSPTSWSSTTYVSLSYIQEIDALLGGTRWASSTITYSFPGYGSMWSTSTTTGYGPSSGSGEPWSTSFAPLSTPGSGDDQIYFAAALQKWANVANLQFTQVADTSTNVGDIRAAYTPLSGGFQAYAYLPGDSSVAGDVWFNSNGTSATDYWTLGSRANFAVLHELGHALGLKHPFYEADFISTILPSSLDTQSYTIMSYSAQAGDIAHTTNFSFYPTTPMILDIQAIQYVYGANNSYHTGDDTYSFSDATTYHETIWDAGGTDTIQYTGYWNSAIDLRSGYGSQIGWYVYVQDAYGANLYAVNNVWIAYGVTIENAIGGSGNDILTGNDANNSLNGSLGNDTLTGAGGNDVFAFAASGNGADTIADFSAGDSITVTGAAFSGAITAGDGSSLLANQVQLAAAGGATTLYIGTDSIAGADVQIQLTGTFAASTFSLYGNTIALNNTPTGSVSITGAATQGQTLTATNNLADADGLSAINYQWQADGIAISGATNSTYLLTQAEVGKTISVVASYTDARGTAETVTSSSISVVANAGAAYTTNFSSWSDFENLLIATQAYESSPAFTSLENTATNLTTQLFSITPSLNSSTSATGYAGGMTAHYYGTNFGTTSAVITSADITDGTNTLSITGSVSAVGGTITSIGFTGQGYTEYAVGQMPLDGSSAVFTSWSSTNPTTLGAVSFSSTGTQTIYSATSATINFSTTVVSDAFGHSASISGLNFSISGDPSIPINLVDTLHSMLAGNDVANGSSGNDELQTFAGNDTLDGKAGADTMVGGLGNDTYVVNIADDVITEASGEGADQVNVAFAAAGTYTLSANLENATVTSGATIAANITGNADSNILTGNAAANTLDGGTGADTLDGGSGDDALIGGADTDTANFSGNRSQYTLTATTTGWTLSGIDGNDTLTGIEFAHFADQTISLGNYAPIGSVTVSGTAAQNQTLTANNTLADINGLGTISYQWKADGTNIAGATGNTYVLTEGDVGKTVTVTASYTDLHGTSESVASSATAAIANVNDTPTGSVTITGIPAKGQTLTAVNTLTDADGLGAITYQWQADGIAINGATNDTYLLTQIEVGKSISVVASYTDGHSTAESVTSGSLSTTTSKYYITASPGSNLLDFELSYGTLGLDGQAYIYSGSTSVDMVFVRPGIVFDFTGSGASADKLYLTGNYIDYTMSLAGTVMTLTRNVGPQVETVKVSKLTSLTNSDKLVFADGTVSTFDLSAYLNSTASAPVPAGEPSLVPSLPATLNATVKAYAVDSTGETFAPVNPGMNLMAIGSSGVDMVYVKAGSNVDASSLGGSFDKIYLTGNWSDYTKTVAGTTIIFERTVGTDVEYVKVAAATGSSNDYLVFADGYVRSNDAKTALQSDANAAITAVTGYSTAEVTPLGTGDIIAGTTGTDILNGTAAGDTIYGNGGTDTINGFAGNDTIVISDPGATAASSATIQITSTANGTDTVIGFSATAVANGGDVLDLSTIANLADSIATGQTLTTDFAANNVFIFNGTPTTIAEAATAIAADVSMVAMAGYIVIADSANHNAVTAYHSADLAGNTGTETALVILSGVNIINLTAANFLV